MGIESLLDPLRGRQALPDNGALAYSGTLSAGDLRDLVAELTDHSGLKSLSLRGCGIDDAGTDLLARVVAFNTNLERLDLRDNAIGGQGAHLLANAMKIYNTGCLKSIVLAGNPCVEEAPELFRGRVPEEAAIVIGSHGETPALDDTREDDAATRLRNVEHGLQNVVDELGGLSGWRAKFNSASEQMAAVLEMLQNDTEQLRMRLDVADISLLPRLQGEFAALSTDLGAQLRTLESEMGSLQGGRAPKALEDRFRSVACHAVAEALESAAPAARLEGAVAELTRLRAELAQVREAAATASSLAKDAARSSTTEAGALAALRGDVAATQRVAQEAYRAACEARLSAAQRTESPASPLKAAGRRAGATAADLDEIHDSLALHVSQEIAAHAEQQQSALSALSNELRAELDDCIVAANRDVAALQVELAVASETGAMRALETQTAAGEAQVIAAAAQESADSAERGVRLAAAAAGEAAAKAAALEGRLEAAISRYDAELEALKRTCAELKKTSEGHQKRHDSAVTKLESKTDELVSRIRQLTAGQLQLSGVMEDLEASLVLPHEALEPFTPTAGGARAPPTTASLQPSEPAVPRLELRPMLSSFQLPASHAIQEPLISDRQFDSARTSSPTAFPGGLANGSPSESELDCLRAQLAVSSKECIRLEATVREQGSVISRLEARLDALTQALAARGGGSRKGEPCAETDSVQTPGSSKRPMGAKSAPEAVATPSAVAKTPIPSLASLCSTFKIASVKSHQQPSLNLNTPRGKPMPGTPGSNDTISAAWGSSAGACKPAAH